jgi:glycosyltransferase involved in cell wall biosynthesis
MARVDVLMPAYNAAATLRDAVESLQTQTLRDIRIIVVDDGSTDATPAILAALAAQDPRIVAVTQQNAGIVEARNAALRHANADFVACLDADDIALPDRLQRTLSYLDAHPDCVAVGGAVAHMDEHGAPLGGLQQPGPPDQADAAKAPALEPYIVQSTLMARRAPMAALGGYRHVPNSEDSDLFWRLAAHGALINLPDVLVRYRVHTASISSTLHNGRIMALGSQLGALSALRRRAGRDDLVFPRALHEALKQAPTLEAMAQAACGQLDASEAQHLRIATACKLMELSRYRPFEPDRNDCAFIRAALSFVAALSPQNQSEVRWYVTVTAARLMRKGMWREAFALTPPTDYPMAAARLLLGR